MASHGKTRGSARLKLVGQPLQLVEHRWDAESIETLREAAAGNQAATRALYRGHVDRVFRHVARILGPHDPDVEDVVQKVFLAALKGAPSFRGTSKVSTWMLGIASRRALDEARSRWRRDRWNRIGTMVGVGRSESRPDERHVALSAAEQLLQTLAPAQRQVFILKEVEGHTLQEIKEMTGVGISTLHARLKAARKKLDAALDEARHG